MLKKYKQTNIIEQKSKAKRIQMQTKVKINNWESKNVNKYNILATY